MKRKSKKPLYALLWLAMPTVITILVVLIIMNWRLSTRINIDISVERVVFTIGSRELTTILNSVGFRSLTIEKFNRVMLSPETFAVADPAKYSLDEDRYAQSAWNSLSIVSPLVIIGDDNNLAPSITLENLEAGSKNTGILDRVRAHPGADVTLELSGARATVLTLKVESQNSSAVLSIQEPFHLLTAYSRIRGISDSPFQADLLTYRIQLQKHNTEIEIEGQPGALVLILTISPEENTDLFPKEGIPVTALNFTRQNEIGNHVTTLIKDGEISYPDYPQLAKISFKATDFIGLDNLKKCRITAMNPSPEPKGIHLLLDGIAGHISIGSREFPHDYRLTLFDSLWQNPQLIILFSIILWIFPTTVGGYKLYKEMKR